MNVIIKNNHIQGTKVKDCECLLIPINSSEWRTYLSNRYMWYCYSVMTRAGLFQDTLEAHEKLGNRFLLQIDLIDNANFDDWVFNFHKEARTEIQPILSRKRIDDKIEIQWVLSTKVLKRKRSNDGRITFGEYIDNIKLYGYEAKNCVFDSFDEWVNNL